MQQKPNIVFILSDDQGAWALGCAGNPEIKTPHIDRLAATGVRFDNFFCASPVCSPARASLVTGKIPSQHGVHDWIRSGHIGEDAIRYLAGQRTYIEMLADDGYICGLSGKWHLGDHQTQAPGFSFWYAHQRGGGPYYNAPMIRDGQLCEEPGYLTEVITDEALRFLTMREEDAQPFYLSVNYTAPHSPWIDSHPEKYMRMYDDCPFEAVPQEEKHPWTIPNAPWGADWKANLQGYYASVTAMDDQIGRIIEKIEQMGQLDQTLIIFMSDNGFSCGQHGFWGKGNGTFPQNMYDSSVKVPAIFSQPGRILSGIVDDSLLSAYDVLPTIMDYVGMGKETMKLEEDTVLPGSSFYSLLVGEKYENGDKREHEREPEPAHALEHAHSCAHEREFVREHVVVFDEYGPVRMVRSKEWKYIHRYPYGPHELYDLVNDPGERENLVEQAQYADRLNGMKATLLDWFVEHADPYVDGAREAVTGAGQIGLAGSGKKNKGKPAFAKLDE